MTAVGTAVDIVPARAADWGQFDANATLDLAYRTNVISPDCNWVISGTYLCMVHRVELRPRISQPSFKIDYLALKTSSRSLQLLCGLICNTDEFIFG